MTVYNSYGHYLRSSCQVQLPREAVSDKDMEETAPDGEANHLSARLPEHTQVPALNPDISLNLEGVNCWEVPLHSIIGQLRELPRPPEGAEYGLDLFKLVNGLYSREELDAYHQKMADYYQS